MRLNVVLVLFAALLALPVARANDTAPADLPAIRAQQVEFRQEALAKQGRFKDVDEKQRQELVAKQTRFIDLTEGKQALADLSPADQLETVNTLEWIKAAITRAEDEQLVCERTKVVGSNRSTRVCRTVAERRAERAEAEKAMEERKMCGAGCRSN